MLSHFGDLAFPAAYIPPGTLRLSCQVDTTKIEVWRRLARRMSRHSAACFRPRLGEPEVTKVNFGEAQYTLLL
jgi:hypothetical protein